MRARVTTTRGFHSIPKCAQVQDADGINWYVERRHLRAPAAPVEPTRAEAIDKAIELLAKAQADAYEGRRDAAHAKAAAERAEANALSAERAAHTVITILQGLLADEEK
jgi:hypothetical protein